MPHDELSARDAGGVRSVTADKGECNGQDGRANGT